MLRGRGDEGRVAPTAQEIVHSVTHDAVFVSNFIVY